jgi:hypothetical protein
MALIAAAATRDRHGAPGPETIPVGLSGVGGGEILFLW